MTSCQRQHQRVLGVRCLRAVILLVGVFDEGQKVVGWVAILSIRLVRMLSHCVFVGSIADGDTVVEAMVGRHIRWSGKRCCAD